MEHYTGNYYYQPLRKGRRDLYKMDGTFPPPDVPAGTLCLTASTAKYRMEMTGDLRILELLPGSFDEPLQCRLRVVSIESGPIYDALSYMWGDPSPTGRIILEDEAFPVTLSLENALRHVRLRNSVRCLWADAVCINQRDVEERGNQVHLMKEIYSRSKTVRVWIDVNLSPENPSVRKLFALQLHGTVDQLGDDPEFWKPLLPLLQNPYWDRLWIQQEVAFAPKLVFHCRGVTIPGNCLMALQLQIYRKSTRCRRPFDAHDAWSLFGRQVSVTKAPSRNLACWREMIKNKVPVDPHSLEPDFSLLRPTAEWQLSPRKWGPWLSTSPIYLLGMLRHSQTLNVTDPRDRVNATLNLVIDYEDDGSQVSYEESLAERYLGVGRILLFTCNSLQFLAMAKLRTIPDPIVQGLPSWAPNWNPPGNAEYFLSPFHAAGDLPMYSTPFQEDVKDGILHARGFRLTKVDRTLSNTNNAFSPLSALSTLFLSTIKSTGCHYEDIRKLASTLTGPSIAELRLGRRYFSKNEAVLYMGILLDYSFVTPGLRIVDLLPYTKNIYEQSQREFTVALRALRKFRHLRPSCLRGLDVERVSATIQETHDQSKRFGHFVQLVHKTLFSGCLASISSATTLAITDGKASVRSRDEIWILFGCPTPMVLRRTASYFLVVSPAYVFDIMNGEAVDRVFTPDDKIGGWSRILKSGCLSPAPLSSYISGRSNWLVEVIRLR
ncbi:heterokaryon incompatibility protein-domain-containing protein [Diplogelasinospora grovesii]|uniref:Heterokaryon incompatibility protein-domain-containing protein n=1 Tax=Diplogelasinospora grovesii TaxID=303347 RepID=A0AAN6S008_9PEZI|nr:heterokaryon incompatibility protein-domain-containing protein [Diplogelasinospora grovesii]